MGCPSASSNKHIKSPETIPYEAKVFSSSVRASFLFNVIENSVSELQNRKEKSSKHVWLHLGTNTGKAEKRILHTTIVLCHRAESFHIQLIIAGKVRKKYGMKLLPLCFSPHTF